MTTTTSSPRSTSAVSARKFASLVPDVTSTSSADAPRWKAATRARVLSRPRPSAYPSLISPSDPRSPAIFARHMAHRRRIESAVIHPQISLEIAIVALVGVAALAALVLLEVAQ